MRKTCYYAVMMLLAGCFPIQHGSQDQTAVIIPETPSYVTAVIVGVENGYAGKCEGSLYDADRMANLLNGFANKSIILKDTDATVSNVSQAFASAIQSSELTIFYYSGHGGSAKTYADKTEDDGRDEYICLYDRGWLDDSIWTVISSTTNRVFLIFDCCHSQTMYRSPVMSRNTMLLRSSGANQVRMLCWSGCPDNTYSYGSNDGGQFTNAILRYFDKDSTYEQIWNVLKSDSTLKKFQDPQKTVIGTDFQTEKIFR